MSDINSLPSVPQAHIREMNKIAAEKYGLVADEQPAQPANVYEQHPMIQADFAQSEQPTLEPQSEQVEQMQESAPENTPLPEPIKETGQALNFRRLKEIAEKAQQERDEAIRFAQEIQSRYGKQPQVEAEEEEIRIGNDDLVEGKHLNKYDKKMRQLEDKIKQYERKTAEVATETRLKWQYPDFDSVVNAESVTQLSLEYPELAKTIDSNQDLYTKAVAAYTLIKKLNINQPDVHKQERLVAQKNAAKPRPVVSVAPQQGDSPLSRANAFQDGLTPELQQQLLREMVAARKSM